MLRTALLLVGTASVAAQTCSDKGCVAEILAAVVARDPNQPEFIQAVTEVIESLEPVCICTWRPRGGHAALAVAKR